MAAAQTRRAIFAGAAALSAVPLVAASSPGALRVRWDALERQRAEFNARRNVTDDEIDAFSDRWNRQQGEILQAPILTRDDALAKLDCAAVMGEMGERTDELDIEAMLDVARYFKRGAV